MPTDYYRVDLRIPPKWNQELELLQTETYQRTGKKVSKGDLIRGMMRGFMPQLTYSPHQERSSSSCIYSKTK